MVDNLASSSNSLLVGLVGRQFVRRQFECVFGNVANF
jgi:hypothetical protein